MLDNSLPIKTEHFDGPLGLLLFLIQKEEMDIRDFDLTKITKQYLDYLFGRQEIDFDRAGDYLFLAVALLWLKYKVAIDNSEEEKENDSFHLPDSSEFPSREELARRLRELQFFQKKGELLSQLPKKGHEIFTRPKKAFRHKGPAGLRDHELTELISVMIRVIVREKQKFLVLEKDRRSLEDKLIFFKKYFKEGEYWNFNEIIQKEEGPTLSNKVMTFIGLLELARLGKVTFFQNEQGEELSFKVLNSLENFDIHGVVS